MSNQSAVLITRFYICCQNEAQLQHFIESRVTFLVSELILGLLWFRVCPDDDLSALLGDHYCLLPSDLRCKQTSKHSYLDSIISENALNLVLSLLCNLIRRKWDQRWILFYFCLKEIFFHKISEIKCAFRDGTKYIIYNEHILCKIQTQIWGILFVGWEMGMLEYFRNVYAPQWP